MKHQWPIDIQVGPITQCLIDGRKRLVKHGWCQESFIDYNGRFCALGAIFNTPCSPARRFLELALPNRHLHANVPSYNDLPSTTGKDILALYDRAIELARSYGV